MRSHYTMAYTGLGVLLLAGVVMSLGVGAVSLTPADIWAVLKGQPVKASHATIIWDFRLARVLLVSLSGASLAAAGAGFQGLFRNPLADPFIVGASSGAALGVIVSVVFSDRIGVTIPIHIAGFSGALLTVLLVYTLAETSSYGSIAGLLLAGVAMSTVLSALASLLLLLNHEVLAGIFAWLQGGFSGRSWSHLSQTAIIAVIGITILVAMSRPLDALGAGEESAESLGLNLRQTRLLIVVGASFATAAAVGAGGIIGFIGLIAPHLARPIFGAKHARLIPASMIIGAILLLLADNAARTIMSPIELPVGFFTALLGGPFFLILLRTSGKRR